MLSDRLPILLANARIVDPSRDLDFPGDLLIADGVIRDAKSGISAAGVPEGTQIIECDGRVVAPGLIDTPIYGFNPDPEAFKAQLAAPIVFPKRMGRADEFGHLVLGVIGNDYLNADVIRLDGGVRFQPR